MAITHEINVTLLELTQASLECLGNTALTNIASSPRCYGATDDCPVTQKLIRHIKQLFRTVIQTGPTPSEMLWKIRWLCARVFLTWWEPVRSAVN